MVAYYRQPFSRLLVIVVETFSCLTPQPSNSYHFLEQNGWGILRILILPVHGFVAFENNVKTDIELIRTRFRMS